MSGCFGNHPVDRWMEGQLNAYAGLLVKAEASRRGDT